jgi:hypothetical protein
MVSSNFLFWIYYLLVITYSLLLIHWLPEKMINEQDRVYQQYQHRIGEMKTCEICGGTVSSGTTNTICSFCNSIKEPILDSKALFT